VNLDAMIPFGDFAIDESRDGNSVGSNDLASVLHIFKIVSSSID
jgi:hypothetical protein